MNTSTTIRLAKTTALRTSREASSTTWKAGRGSASNRFWRRRRTMFSTSMIASSTTSPTAMTRPASTMVLMVPPLQCSTSAAAMRDIGIAETLINAVRQSKRKPIRMITTSRQPIHRACDRLSSDISMKVAGRKMAESISRPTSPGRSKSRAASTLWVTSRVFPQGCFSTMSRSPGPSLITASPIGAGCPITTSATSPMRRGTPLVNRTTVCARSSMVTIGARWRTGSRWLGVSMNPPALTRAASPAARTTASRLTPCIRSRSGSTNT